MRALTRLPAMQRRAESMLQDTFTSYAVTRQKVDGLDKDVETSTGTTPGKLAGPSTQTRDTNTRYISIGGVEHPVVEGGLHIPIGSPTPAIGTRYKLTTLGPETDPALLNSKWQVVDVPAKSYATARRLDVVRVS